MTLFQSPALLLPQLTPLELLQRLGDTPDEVAERLRDLGIRGQREKGGLCPLANYLRGHGYRALVFRTFFGADDRAYETPPACRGFVDQFDAGSYPDLAVRP